MTSSQQTKDKIHLYIFAFVTVSLSSGLVYGYPHLRNNLLDNGSNLTESQLGIVYTVGSWTVQGGRFFSGIARDRFGTRNIAFLCIVCAMSGCLGLAFCNENNVLALSISFFFVGLGSGGQLCLQPVASLFAKKWQGTILASLSGAFQISGLVFLVLRQMTTGRKWSYGYFALLLGLIALYALYLLPKDQFVKKEDVDHNIDVRNDCGEDKEKLNGITQYNTVSTGEKDDIFPISVDDPEKNHYDILETATIERNQMDRSSSQEIDEKNNQYHHEDSRVETQDHQRNHMKQHDELSVTEELYNDPIENIENSNNHQTNNLSNEYPTDSSTQQTTNGRKMNDTKDTKQNNELPFPLKNEKTALQLIKSTEYILLLTWFTIMLIPMQYYIGTIAFQLERKGDDDGRHVSFFSIFYAAAALISPALGKIADLAGLGLTQFIATILVSISLFILTSLSLNVHLIGMASYGIGRMTVFGMYFTNVGKRFGYTHYGTLAGLGLLISAIFSLLQYPLIDAAANGNEDIVNWISGFILLGTGLPYCIWLWMKERIEKRASGRDHL